MKCRFTILMMLLYLQSFAGGLAVDTIYIVYYATVGGKTGHIGIAVDNYRIVFREVKAGKGRKEVSDTIANGKLTYYDLWPEEDQFTAARTAMDIPAAYYKLPVSSTEEITLNLLYDSGIPHKEFYPCDGILKIKTTWQQDQQLVHLLDSMMETKRLFNAQLFNCADFVRVALEDLLRVDLRSKEFVMTGWSTTPNKLYRSILRLDNVEVIKDPGRKPEGSFLKERIIYEIVNHKKPGQ